MSDIITLSDDEEEGRRIEGIPTTFGDDNLSRFSFDVGCSQHVSNNIEPDYFENDFYDNDIYVPYEPEQTSPILTNILPKTPKSISRRRSVSTSCLKSEIPNVKSPPKFEVCSSSINISSDEEDETDELGLRALLSPKKRKTREKIGKVNNEFFGVYCLISRSDRPCYKNRCYIGYTVDPNRRITQHNGGRLKGGAKKTDSRGPWDMVCVIHGFPNHVAALRFEWAWQNPNVSKVIKEKQLKKEKKETPFAYQLRIACNLMSSVPFNRYALTFRWLITNEEIPFPVTCLPPEHIKKKYGKVNKEISIVSDKKDDYEKLGECHICGKDILKIWHFSRCLSTTCRGNFHTSCLSEHALKSSKTDNLKTQLFPVSGNCPICSHTFVWGDIIREQRRLLKISAKCENDELKLLVIRKTVI